MPRCAASGQPQVSHSRHFMLHNSVLVLRHQCSVDVALAAHA
jgi:hypothetical protein